MSRPRERPWTREAFAETHARIVESFLEQQPRSPFFLARLRRDELIGGAEAAEFVWIVDYSEATGRVHWVSEGDFFMYADRVESFAIADPTLLPRLSEWKAAHPDLFSAPS